MPKTLSRADVLQRLAEDGWSVVRVRGDHHQLKHPTKPGRVTIAHPVKDIPIGTLRSVFRQAGWEWPPC